jgi:capsular exopolysaccharide synthesis family protein
VIIDADMRRPRLRSIFDLRESEGLSSILSSDMTVEQMLGTIARDEASGLFVLTSGPVPPNPAELLGSDQMRKLIELLGQHFTHVVIDSPPVNSFTDGVLIASIVDGVLLVVHGGKSSRGVVRRSRQLLLDIGAKIVGVVLNNVSAARTTIITITSVIITIGITTPIRLPLRRPARKPKASEKVLAGFHSQNGSEFRQTSCEVVPEYAGFQPS